VVKSAETLIVGGLIKDTQTKTLRKLPFLGDLPFLGSFFRSETVDFRKSELVIFLTPYIISGDVSTREHEKFFDSEGEMIDFDTFGGFDYALGQEHSQGAFRRDNSPYWELERWQFPRYWSPRDLYHRAAPYQDRRNQFEGLTEGNILLEEHLLRKAYEESLSQKVASTLQSSEALGDFDGSLELALQVRRDGVLKDISFINPRAIQDQKLKRLILQTIRSTSPWPEFPKGLDTEEELFDFRLEFRGKKQIPETPSLAKSE